MLRTGVCHSVGEDLATRLLSLHQQLTAVVQQYAPHMAAVEQTFVNKDGAGTLKLGQARGIAMLVPAQAGIPVGEYAPNSVKKAVVGVGHADKQQIVHMVRAATAGRRDCRARCGGCAGRSQSVTRTTHSPPGGLAAALKRATA